MNQTKNTYYPSIGNSSFVGGRNQQGGSQDNTIDTMTSLGRAHFQMRSTEPTHSSVQRTEAWQGRKFSFLRALNAKELGKGTQVLEARNNQEFRPYLVERSGFGHLLQPPVQDQDEHGKQVSPSGSKNPSKANSKRSKADINDDDRAS